MINHKVCSKCKIEKSVTEFTKTKCHYKYGVIGRCKECSRELCKKWRKNNHYKRLKYIYGVSLEDIKQIYKIQNELCAICGGKQIKGTNAWGVDLHIDHNHKNGKVRGLLCRNCNTGIGLFDDNPELLLKAIKYLEKYD